VSENDSVEVLRRMAERREQNVADTVCRSGPDQAWVARMQDEAAALREAISALSAAPEPPAPGVVTEADVLAVFDRWRTELRTNGPFSHGDGTVFIRMVRDLFGNACIPAPSAGVSVSEGLIGSVSPVMGQVDAVSPAMVERALDAYSAYWCEPPNTQACCECDGKGISGIADTAGGCDACGGLGWTSAGGDDREAMRAALTAAAQVRANDSGVG
jgi:hypothetical protein